MIHKLLKYIFIVNVCKYTWQIAFTCTLTLTVVELGNLETYIMHFIVI
jgi:hypothetical protein